MIISCNDCKPLVRVRNFMSTYSYSFKFKLLVSFTDPVSCSFHTLSESVLMRFLYRWSYLLSRITSLATAMVTLRLGLVGLGPGIGGTLPIAWIIDYVLIINTYLNLKKK